MNTYVNVSIGKKIISVLGFGNEAGSLTKNHLAEQIS